MDWGQQWDLEAEYVGTTLFLHILNINDFVVNTQEPAPAWSASVRSGALSSTLTCLQASGHALTHQEFHSFYGTVGSWLDYNDLEEASFFARGLGHDVFLDGWIDGSPTPSIVVFFRVVADALAGEGQAAIPNVVVRATGRASSGLGLGDAAYDEARMVFRGESMPATLVAGKAIGPRGQDVDGITSDEVDGAWVYGFNIPLDVSSPYVERDEGLNLRLDIFVENPNCAEPGGAGTVMPSGVEIYTDAAHRPTLIVRNQYPLWPVWPPAESEERPAPKFDGGEPVAHFRFEVTSPWGAQDVDDQNASLDIVGPVDAKSIRRIYTADHARGPVHYGWEGRDIQFEWDFREGQALPGTYRVVFSVPNSQNTSVLTGSYVFVIEGGDREAPAPSIAVLVAALAMVGAARAVRRPNDGRTSPSATGQ